MLKRKCILLFLSMGLIFGALAKAEETKIIENSSTVIITEDADGAESGTLIVVKKGADAEIDENIYAVTDADTKDGKLIFTFDMQNERNGESSDGEYNFYIGRLNKDVLTGSFFYASSEVRNILCENIKKVSSTDDLHIIIEKEDNQTALKAIGCDMEGYYAANDKNEIISLFYKYITDTTELNEENTRYGFNLAIAAQNINSNDDIEKYMKEINFEFEGVKYSDIEVAVLKEWIKNSINSEKPYGSITELEAVYKRSIMLYNIRESRQTELEDNLKKYADELGMSSNDIYVDYVETKSKDNINKKILTELKKRTFLDINTLLNVIGNNLKPDLNVGTGSGGNSSGGSSSGGGKTGGYVSSVPVNETLIETKNETTAVYKDMNQAEWALDAVMKLTEKNIISGNGDGTFNPNGVLTREAFVKMLVLASGMYDQNAKCNFSDVSQNAWYYSYVASAENAGLVSGVSDTEFGTGRNISRQDMAVLCYRYMKNNKTPEKKRDAVQFVDSELIEDYAKIAVDELYMAGIINGVGGNKFEPDGTATRAQGAMIIYNLFF